MDFARYIDATTSYFDGYSTPARRISPVPQLEFPHIPKIRVSRAVDPEKVDNRIDSDSFSLGHRDSFDLPRTSCPRTSSFIEDFDSPMTRVDSLAVYSARWRRYQEDKLDTDILCEQKLKALELRRRAVILADERERELKLKALELRRNAAILLKDKERLAFENLGEKRTYDMKKIRQFNEKADAERASDSKPKRSNKLKMVVSRVRNHLRDFVQTATPPMRECKYSKPLTPRDIERQAIIREMNAIDCSPI